MILSFDTTPDDEDLRLDTFLSRASGDEFSRTSIQKWIKMGNVRLGENSQTLKSSYRVRQGERYTISIPPIKKNSLEPIPMDIPILLDEEDFLIISKPSGISSHGGPGDDRPSLVNGLLYIMNTLSTVGGSTRPGIVHRLDKPTSGLMVIAKNDRCHTALSKLFQQRQVEKIYYAWLVQTPKSSEGRIETRISRHPTERLKMQVSEKGRIAVTNYQIEKVIQSRKGKRFSLARVRIETGRTHQIRVHFQSLQCPVVGDMLYSRSGSEFIRYGLLLFSQMLCFPHPFEKREIKIELPLPETFLSFEQNAKFL